MRWPRSAGECERRPTIPTTPRGTGPADPSSPPSPPLPTTHPAPPNPCTSLATEAKFVREEKAYWARKCSLEPDEGGLPVCPQLPLRKLGSEGAFKVTRLSSSISADDWAKVHVRCQKEGITPNSLLFTCFARVLATWSSTKHFLMNMAFFNRAGA